MESLSSFRKPNSDKTLGIEWEMFWNHHDSKYRDAGKHLNFFYITRDGSLSGLGLPDRYELYDRELVSQPLPFKWLLKELERVNKIIPQVYTNHTCGIHVHVSRKWATSKKVDHLVAFMRSLTDDEALSAFGRAPNNYCKPMRDWSKTSHRYYAMNLTRKDTIEFRVFRSGDVKWAQYCVKLVNYMMNQANTLNKDAFFAFVDMEQPR